MNLTAPLIEARSRGSLIMPVLTMNIRAGGSVVSAEVIAPAGGILPCGAVTAVSERGGWRDPTYGADINTFSVEPVKMSVRVSDPRGRLWSALDTFHPDGAQAKVRWGSADVAEDDWSTVFTGILSDWSTDEAGVVELHLKTDDSMLRTPVPRTTFVRAEWGSAADPTVFGAPLPIALGVFDSILVTARGAVPCPNIRYDETRGYWWVASGTMLKRIRRVYFNGEPQSADIWYTIKGVFGGSLMTIIAVLPGHQPPADTIVTCDCEGPDVYGLDGEDPVVNPVVQLGLVITEWAYASDPTRGWSYSEVYGFGPPLTWSWTEVAAHFASRGYDSAVRFGGDQQIDSASGIIDTFMRAYPLVKVFWNEFGLLDIFDLRVLEDDRGAVSGGGVRAATVSGGRFKVVATDRREVYSAVRMPYLYTPAEQKFGATLVAEDPGAISPPLELVIENRWSQGRFTLE